MKLKKNARIDFSIISIRILKFLFYLHSIHLFQYSKNFQLSVTFSYETNPWRPIGIHIEKYEFI